MSDAAVSPNHRPREYVGNVEPQSWRKSGIVWQGRSKVRPKIGGLGGLTAALLLFLFLTAACGGPGFEPPTAIPAEVVVPDQHTPVYADDVARFTVKTPEPVRFAVGDPSPGGLSSSALQGRPTVVLPYQQTPSALGVVRGSAVLRNAPDGERIGTLPSGATVTITGQTEDGRAYAVFGHDGIAGWIAASTVTVFGGDDLLVVEESSGPGPIATLIAEAMQPVGPSVLEGVGQEAALE